MKETITKQLNDIATFVNMRKVAELTGVGANRLCEIKAGNYIYCKGVNFEKLSVVVDILHNAYTQIQEVKEN